MGLAARIDRSTERASDALRRRSVHAAVGLWSWIRHRPEGFWPRWVCGGAGPLGAIPRSYFSGLGTNGALELRALLALAPASARGRTRNA